MKMSRRTALKVMGVSVIAASALAVQNDSVTVISEDVKGKIVIVGGGAGALMMLARLKRTISSPDITIIAPNEIHLYQPGQVFIGAGEMAFEDIVMDNKKHLESDEFTWIKDEVKTFEPDANRVITRANKVVKYDYLIVATGIEYHYERIEGLTKEDIGTNGITSVYLNDLEKGTAVGATATWKWFQELKEKAKTKKLNIIYTQPNTAIKCGGAPQKILYLSADYLKKDGLSANYTFATSGGKLFPLPDVNKSLLKVQDGYDKITNKFKHHFKSIDIKNKKATFVHAYEEKVYDKEFDETEMVSKSDTVVLDYDFIHITPPMTGVSALVRSNLVNASGWLDVDKYTLQHKAYKNIFGIGDTCGTPMGKTGGTARKHAPVVTENLISVMKKKEPEAKFDGYTVCPLKTAYGDILMAEFNYKGAAPSIPYLSIAEPRSFWWAFDRYQLKPMYEYLMLNGRM